jgi:hypothetical protein
MKQGQRVVKRTEAVEEAESSIVDRNHSVECQLVKVLKLR